MLIAGCAMAAAGCSSLRRLPAGVSYEGPPRPVGHAEFLRDMTWMAPDGHRVVDQQIFDRVFQIVRDARRLVVMDMFLFNEFAGELQDGVGRKLCSELTDLLVSRKAAVPELDVFLITDPVNTVYGSVEAKHLQRLTAAGVHVVVTDLDRLRDSNPLYSAPWRLLVHPFGTGPGSTVTNPIGAGRVSLRSLLAMLNFKANHRKVVVADSGDGLAGLVTSANPHDASSAHWNVALAFDGEAASDLLDSERAVLAFSGGPDPGPVSVAPAGSGSRLQVVTEGKIKDAALRVLGRAGQGDAVDLLMFYLSEREVLRAIREARVRGAAVRLLLDPNKDAFGRTKNGVPNRPAARDLIRSGVDIRWCGTSGEQAHSKMLLCRYKDGTSALLLGSANLTRRNLCDLNLETDVLLESGSESGAARGAAGYFDLLWNNDVGREFSLDYAAYGGRSLLRYLEYRWAEATGMCTF